MGRRTAATAPRYVVARQFLVTAVCFTGRSRGTTGDRNARPTRGVSVKTRTLTAAAAAAVALSFGVAVPASATDNIQPFGTQERLNDFGTGGPMIGYTVMGLTPSSDPVPHNGQLFEAPITVNGFGGWATPLVPLFNARAESSALYRALPESGVGAAPPGGSSMGKLY